MIRTGDVVICGDHTEVECTHIHFIFYIHKLAERPGNWGTLTNSNTFRINKVVQSIFNQLREMIRDVLVTGVVEIIVIGILKHPFVEKCPCQNILESDSEYVKK